MRDIELAKQRVRERVWRGLIDSGAAPADSWGKIPAFRGSEQTAQRLDDIEAWGRSTTVKANPDYAQLPIRARALQDGKLLYMAVPGMRGRSPFYRLAPNSLEVSPQEAASKETAARVARRVGPTAMRPVDIVVCGSVAVNRTGARLGKGAGYSDLEIALLIEAGLVTAETVIIAPVHQLQLIEEPIPETEHDVTVDYIVTPDEIIHCPIARRPAGVIWDHLTDQQITAIPILADLRARRASWRSRPAER